MTTVEQAPDHRAELIRDLRRLADWFEANPKVPVGKYPSVEVSYFPGHHGFETDAAAFAEVRRIADGTGATIEEDAVRIRATRALGRASYKVMAHSADHMARYEAATTYYSSVEPETAGAR